MTTTEKSNNISIEPEMQPNVNYVSNIYDPVSTDESLREVREQYKKDSESNRELRQNVYRKIIKIMICELIFIGVMLVLMLGIPMFKTAGLTSINSVKPSILIMACVFFAYLFYSVGFLPSFRITYKKSHIHKTSINSKRFVRAVIILLFCLFLIYTPKETMYLDCTKLNIDNNYTPMLVVIETVFVKTTLLLSFIIQGLFKSKSLETSNQ